MVNESTSRDRRRKDTVPSETINICYTIGALTTPYAGTDGHLLRLIRALDRTRFSPLLVVLRHSASTAQFDDLGVSMKVLGFRSFWHLCDWNCVLRLARTLRDQSCDIIESHLPDAHLMSGLAARLARTPVVLTATGELVDCYGWRERLSCRIGNVFVNGSMSNSRTAAHVSVAVESTDSGRDEVIYNGVDLEAFDSESAGPTQPRFRAVIGRPLVVLAANLRREENVSMFLRAAARVAPKCRDIRFVLLGAGPQEQRLRQLAIRLGVADHCLWLGSVPAVAPYFRAAQIGCLSSAAEGCSNVLLEYMAAALPVVATDVGGNQESVVHGETGFLVAKGDVDSMAARLIELLDSPAKRVKLGVAGRRRVAARFPLRAQTERYEQLYERLVAATEP